jgi:hypothetical protein
MCDLGSDFSSLTWLPGNARAGPDALHAEGVTAADEGGWEYDSLQANGTPLQVTEVSRQMRLGLVC